MGSWPTTFDTAPTSSGICNSFRNIFNVAAGFTQVCIVNACGAGCNCTDSVRFAGQIQLNGYSTSTPLGTGVAPFPACSIPFFEFSNLNFGSGDVYTSGEYN